MREHATVTVNFLHRAVPVRRLPEGVRALSKDRPINPESVCRHLESKYGGSLSEASNVMRALARPMTPRVLSREAHGLYEDFRPEIPKGVEGWGAKRRLNLDAIRAMAR